MPKYRVYFDARLQYSGSMEVEAPTQAEAEEVAKDTVPGFEDLGGEHVTEFTVTEVSREDAEGNEIFGDEDEEPSPDADPNVFLAYWHQGQADGHWSSPNGCHEQCPVCSGEEPEPEDFEQA